MNNNKPSNTLAVIGLVLGIIAIIFSFIPCVGTIAFVPGVVGLILGVIAFMKAKDEGHPKGMPIAVIVVSILACAISAFQIFALGNMASSMQEEMKDYASCEELKVEYEKTQEEMATLTKSMEEDASLSAISKMTKLGIRVGNLRKQSEKMDCPIDFDNFDPSGMNDDESDDEGEDEEDGESEIIEDDQGN